MGVSARTVTRLAEKHEVYARQNHERVRIDLKKAAGSYDLAVREAERIAHGKAKVFIHSIETPSGLVVFRC